MRRSRRPLRWIRTNYRRLTGSGPFTQKTIFWIRNTATNDRRALTTDGESRHDYASRPESNTGWVTAQRAGLPAPPVARWSSDSKRILTHQLDQRRVPEVHLIQSAHESGLRPKLWSFAYPFPGDTVARAAWWIFDAESGRATPVAAPPVDAALAAPLEMDEAWWADSGGTTAYYIEHERGMKAWWLKAIDAATGQVRTVAEERGPTLTEATLHIGTKPNVHVTRDGKEVIWFSERDGFGHLYLLDAATGQFKHQITKGPWVMRCWFGSMIGPERFGLSARAGSRAEIRISPTSIQWDSTAPASRS